MHDHSTTTVRLDTGLSALHQESREFIAAAWSMRVLALMNVTGCSARLALRAVEDADRELDARVREYRAALRNDEVWQ